MTTAPKAYSYLRFSTPEQALGDSKRRQLEAGRAWAAEKGLTLDEELSDEGVSGFRGANTRDDTALGAFLKAVHLGTVPRGSYLIVESLDRLSRDRLLNAQNTLTGLLLAGIIVVTLGDRRELSEESVRTDPTALLVSLLVFMRANEESETKADRLRKSWANKRDKARETGARLTSTGPAWLAPTAEGFAVIEDRADVVRRIFAETLEGRGQHRIAAGVTADGVPTWRGGEGWHRTYVRKIVDSTTVVGTLTPHVTERLDGGGTARRPIGEVIEGYYPPVIDLETWHRARSLVGTRAAAGTSGRGRHAGTPVRHVLAGIARCPLCAGTMTRVAKGPGGGRTYLVCAKAKRGAGCVYRAVPVDMVETAIMRETVTLLDNPPSTNEAEEALREAVHLNELTYEAVVNELEDLAQSRRQRRGLTPMERGRKEELDLSRQRLIDARKALQADLQVAGSRMVDDRVSRLWKALDDMDGDDRTAANAAMRETFSTVVVDHEREVLTFGWRHGGESEISYASPF